MNEEVKEKWVAALRSGKYEQGQASLRTGDSYCCLGVLCDIGSKEASLGEWEKYEDSNLAYVFRHDVAEYAYCTGFPPIPVKEWAGISQAQVQILAAMNDSYGNSFSEIAAYIEDDF